MRYTSVTGALEVDDSGPNPPRLRSRNHPGLIQLGHGLSDT